MADSTAAILWVLKQEDATLSGVVVNLGDGGGLTRYGIASNAHTALPPDFYTASPATALTYAKVIYRGEYWDAMQGDAINDLPLAASLLSFAINDGVSRAVKILQGVLGITAYGDFGPQTLAATNGRDALTLAAALRVGQANWYRAIAPTHPTVAADLPGLLKRAARIYPSLT